MRPSLFKKLWESSPGSICRAVGRRVEQRKQKAGWYKIQRGPLTGMELFFPNATGDWKRMIEGTFDDFIYRALEGESLKGACCWDIGAHFGYHTLTFAALGAEVLAFEPNPHNIAQLKLNVEKNPDLSKRIRHISAAVSDRDGETIFVQSNDVTGPSSGSRLQNATAPSPEEAYAMFEQKPVKTVRIDTLIERGEKIPDIIKIDVEGAEQMVLQGGKELLAAHKPILLMEIHHICLMFHVQEFLGAIDYKLRLLDEAGASGSRCFIMATKR